MRVGMERPVTRVAGTVCKHHVCGPHLPPTRDWGAWKMVRKSLGFVHHRGNARQTRGTRRGSTLGFSITTGVWIGSLLTEELPVSGTVVLSRGEAAGPRRAGDVAGRLSYSVIITCR